jgi:PIN domain nuclease of toxin-antitoxin system
MRLLLDTHVLIWAVAEPARLGVAARSAIVDRSNAVEVSSISAWEISIKRALGRLRMPDGLVDSLVDFGFVEAPFTIAHGLAAGALPALHRDPFDRALIAQAAYDGAVLVTADRQIARYPVAVLDATT